jgi:hypothetical protein
MNELYERSFDLDPYTNTEIKLYIGEVVKSLSEAYKARGLEIPKSFREQIRKEAERMGGGFHRSQQGAGDYIVGLKAKNSSLFILGDKEVKEMTKEKGNLNPYTKKPNTINENPIIDDKIED